MLTIIIVTWNSKEALLACLASIARKDNPTPDCEIIVVDNASTDGTAEAIELSVKDLASVGLRLIRNSENLGLSRATNQAVQQAKGDWILLCNPDIIFEGNIGTLLSYGQSQPRALSTAEMVGLDGNLQRVIHRRFPTITRVFFEFGSMGSYLDEKIMHHLVRRYYCYEDERFAPVAEIESTGASCLLLNRDTVVELGLIFDPLFPVWWNDVDLSRRAEGLGIKRVVISNVRVTHGLGVSSTKKMESARQRYIFCRGMMHYARRWNMHPLVLRLLFVIDAVAGISLGPFFQSRANGMSKMIRKSVRYAAAQVSAVLTA